MDKCNVQHLIAIFQVKGGVLEENTRGDLGTPDVGSRVTDSSFTEFYLVLSSFTDNVLLSHNVLFIVWEGGD